MPCKRLRVLGHRLREILFESVVGSRFVCALPLSPKMTGNGLQLLKVGKLLILVQGSGLHKLHTRQKSATPSYQGFR